MKTVCAFVKGGEISNDDPMAGGAGITLLAKPDGDERVVPATVVFAG